MRLSWHRAAGVLRRAWHPASVLIAARRSAARLSSWPEPRRIANRYPRPTSSVASASPTTASSPPKPWRRHRPAADRGAGRFRQPDQRLRPQGPPFDSIDEDNVVPLRSFNDNRFIFEEVETVADGLGPTYNAQSCRECHQNVVTGGASQVAEHRTGHC